MEKLTLLAASAILQNINNLSKRVDGLDRAVHETALQCMLHAESTGDVMLADRLVKTLGGKNSVKAIEAAVKAGHEPFKMGRMTGYNVRGLVMWFIRYSPIMWNADGKPGLLKATQGLYDQLLNRNEGKAWNIETAAEHPFWTLDEVRREMERQPFTIDSVNTIVIGLKDRVDKAIEAGTFKGDPAAVKAYITELAKIPVPAEDESHIIVPSAPNIKGTTFGEPKASDEPKTEEPKTAEQIEAERLAAEQESQVLNSEHQNDQANRGEVKVA